MIVGYYRLRVLFSWGFRIGFEIDSQEIIFKIIVLGIFISFRKEANGFNFFNTWYPVFRKKK